MSLYFLVEGRRTEKRLYPRWLEALLPQWDRVSRPGAVTKGSYFLISGEGYPSLLQHHLLNAIADVNDVPEIVFLVVVLDTDGANPDDKVEEVIEAAGLANEPLRGADLVVVPQHACLESWLLGNQRIVRQRPSRTRLREYLSFFDVTQTDPENSPTHGDFRTIGQFHFSFVREVFSEVGLTYSKRNPGHAADPSYLEQLMLRSGNTGHISTFQRLVDFCSRQADSA